MNDASQPWLKYQTPSVAVEGDSAPPWLKYSSLVAPQPAASPVGVLGDIGKSSLSGVASGVSGLLGLPALMLDGVDWAQRQTLGRVNNLITKGSSAAPTYEEQQATEQRVRDNSTFGRLPAIDKVLPRPQDVVGVIERAAGEKLYEPQTTFGGYAKTAGEFAAALPFTAGSVAQRAAQIVVPAVTSETAGQLTKGSQYEPAARIAGALLGGVGTAIAQKPNTATSILAKEAGDIPEGILNSAEALMKQSSEIGVPITRSEAINQVTNGAYPRLAEMQKVVETAPRGSEIMGKFMAQRPDQVAKAGDDVFNLISATPQDPTRAAIAARNAAEADINATRSAINEATSGAYKAAEGVRIPADKYAALMADDLYAQALKEVRSDKALGRNIAQLSDDSAPVVQLVIKNLKEKADAAGSFSNPVGRSMTRSSNIAKSAQEADNILREAAPTYAQAQDAQAMLRGKYLEPKQVGGTGKIAGSDDIIAQARAAFPDAPAPRQSEATKQIIEGLTRQDPKAAADLVRARLESTFRESTQDLSGGANQAGGAKFAAQIMGNKEQAKSIEAGIRALPEGDVKFEGFQKLIDTLQATGRRLPKGSDTQSKLEIQDALSKGGVSGTAANAAAGGGLKLPEIVRDFYKNYRYGKNSEEIARLLTDPSKGDVWKQLSKTETGSADAVKTIARLLTISPQSADKSSVKKHK